MKKIVCEMCECTEFVKKDGLFVCQDCGCKYSVADAKKMMREFADEKQTEDCSCSESDSDEKEIAIHTANSPNRIFVEVIKVGHETYTTQSVTSLSVLLGGEPQPVFVEGPDQVGHIGTEISVQNLAGKEIKYVTVYLAPFNAVGDQVACTVQGHSVYGIEITGPLVVGQRWEGYSDGMWYNNSIVGATIDHVHVIYMDDTEEIYEGKEFYKGAGDTACNKSTIVFHGFTKYVPVVSKVSIRINGLEVGTVSRGEKFVCECECKDQVDLKYAGDFGWRKNVLTLKPGTIHVQLEYSARTLISNLW